MKGIHFWIPFFFFLFYYKEKKYIRNRTILIKNEGSGIIGVSDKRREPHCL